MKKLITFLLIYFIVFPPQLFAQGFPPLYTASIEIPGNGYDDNDNDVTDETIATSIVQDANAAGNYHFHFKDCEKVVFANVTDSTFPNTTRVEKPAGSVLAEGEIGCYIPNLPANTYTLHIFYSAPVGAKAIWSGINKQMRYNMKVETASFLAATNTPQWQQLVYTGTAENYYNQTNGGDQVSFVWPGGPFTLVFRADDLRLACGYLSIGATPTRTCPGESGGTPSTADYEFYLVDAPNIPTAYDSPAFNNANQMLFSGTQVGTICGGTLTVKGLWQNTTIDRRFFSIICNDTSAVTLSTANDFTPGLAEDQFDFRSRMDLSQVLDTNAYQLIANLHPVYSDADWGGAGNTRDYTISLNTTVVRNISGSSWNIFIASDLGTNISPDTTGLCQATLIDRDTDGTTSSKYFKGTGNSVSQWGTCKYLSTLVPAGGDTTPPSVTSPAIPAGTVEQTSFIMTANTNENGLCQILYGDSISGSYTFTSPGTQSVNNTCTESATNLVAGTKYFAVMRVSPPTGPSGNSSEVNTTTDPPPVPNCTHYASNDGTGDGTTQAKPYKISNFWAAGQAGPGKILCLLDGTYKGASNMITPPAGLNGNALNPIIVRALNDGGPWINGESVNRPVLLSDNDFFILEGFDASNSPSGVVVIGSGAANNIIRRVCAWDSVPTANERVWGITGDSHTQKNNLIEDSCGFGIGRRALAMSQGGSGTTIRRFWASYTNTSVGGPESAYQMAYNGSYHVLENVIGTWRQVVDSDSVAAVRHIVHLANEGTNHKILGSMFYIRSPDLVDANTMISTDWASVQHGPVELRDLIVNTEQSTKKPLSLSNGSGVCVNCTFNRVTEIGGTASSIGGVWTVTNHRDYANMAAAITATAHPFQTGANCNDRACMCLRMENGSLTATKLWPWPMDARIKAALTRDGRNPADYLRGTGNTVTSEVETQYGMTIPAACKS